MNYLRHPLFLISVKYGLLSGAMSIFVLWVFYWLGQNPLFEQNFLVIEVIILGVFLLFGMKEFKDRHNEGQLRFWQGMTFGFSTYLLTALLFALGVWLFVTINEALIPEFVELTVTMLKNTPEEQIERAGKEFYERQLAEAQSVKAFDFVLGGFLKKLLIGMFLTPIFSIILRK